MNIRGSETLDAPREVVFAAICDPDTLLGVIPGCSEIEQISDTEYRGQIALRLPGIVDIYSTVVRLVNADAPSYGELEGEVVGRGGSITGRATFRLAETDGKTTVAYEGRAVIGGPLARLDGRFVEGLAGSLVHQGLGNLNSRLMSRPPEAVSNESRSTTRQSPA